MVLIDIVNQIHENATVLSIQLMPCIFSQFTYFVSVTL